MVRLLVPTIHLELHNMPFLSTLFIASHILKGYLSWIAKHVDRLLVNGPKIERCCSIYPREASTHSCISENFLTKTDKISLPQLDKFVLRRIVSFCRNLTEKSLLRKIQSNMNRLRSRIYTPVQTSHGSSTRRLGQKSLQTLGWQTNEDQYWTEKLCQACEIIDRKRVRTRYFSYARWKSNFDQTGIWRKPDYSSTSTWNDDIYNGTLRIIKATGFV